MNLLISPLLELPRQFHTLKSELTDRIAEMTNVYVMQNDVIFNFIGDPTAMWPPYVYELQQFI
jgi:hypothetical protein